MILDLITDAIAAIGEWIQKVLIALVAGVFHIVNYVYQIFIVLAEGTILDSSMYDKFVIKMYTILGVVMLFVLAYNILLYIVDPDKKDSTRSTEKVLTNLVTSVILVIISPYIFNFMITVQGPILHSNAIGAFFSEENQEGSTIDDGGKLMAINTFKPFFTPVDGSDGSSTMNESTVPSGDEGVDCSSEGSCSLKTVIDNAKNTGSFRLFKAFAKNISDSESANPVDYDWFLALIVGCFLCYVIISFCFDLGVRVFKFAFCQIIAPIAIMCRVIPNQEDIFKKWLKVLTDTYLSVFLRIFVMNFGVYFVAKIEESDFLSKLFEGNPKSDHLPNDLFVKAFLVLGLVAFIRSAPKLISDLFGFGSGDLKLGIKDKLKAGGAFAAYSAARSGLGTTMQNAVHNFGKKDNWKNKNGKVTAGSVTKNLFRGIGSATAGGLSGIYHGGKSGWSASSFMEAQTASDKAVAEAVYKRNKREKYKSDHGGTLGGVIWGHISESAGKIARFAGFNNVEEIKREVQETDDVKSKKDALSDSITSALEDAARKNKSFTFGLSDKSTTKLRELMMDYQTAQAVGYVERKIKNSDGTESVERISLQQIDAEYNKYKKDFSDQIAERVMRGTDKDFATYLDEKGLSSDEKNMLRASRVHSEQYKATLLHNLESEFVKQANERARENYVWQLYSKSALADPELIQQYQEAVKQGVGDKYLHGFYTQIAQNDKEIQKMMEDHKDDLESLLITYDNLHKGTLSMGEGSAIEQLKPTMERIRSEDQILINRYVLDEQKKNSDSK